MIDTRPITSRQNIQAREQIIPARREANICMTERWISAIAGGALIWLGVSRLSTPLL